MQCLHSLRDEKSSRGNTERARGDVEMDRRESILDFTAMALSLVAVLRRQVLPTRRSKDRFTRWRRPADYEPPVRKILRPEHR